MDIDTGCGQTDAFLGVHGVEHIIDDTLNFRIHFFDRLGDFAKALVRICNTCKTAIKFQSRIQELIRLLALF